jgi:ribosomal protein S17
VSLKKTELFTTAIMKIEEKVWPEYFEAILKGEKTFELRLADFKCQKGDILVLREWDPKKKDYTGRVIKKKITYVLRTKDLPFWGKNEVDKFGYQIIGFRED